MNSELIMKTDLLDILFEKRNKAYGAYIIRKFYNNRLIKSLAIMMTTVIVFCAFTLLPDNTTKSNDLLVIEPQFADLPPAPKVPEIKPKFKKQATTPPVSSLKPVSNFIFVESKDSADQLQDLNDLAIGAHSALLSNLPGNQLIGVFAPGDTGITEALKTVEPTAYPAKPINNPDIMPEYPGGMEALRKFLMKNLANPRDLEEGESIGVKVMFVVGYDGKLQRFEVIQDGGSEFNNEVIRVLKKMPVWIPGKSKGQNVSVYYTIPVKFIGEG